MNKRMLIVGNKFSDFSINDNVIMLKDIEILIKNKKLSDMDIYYELGQGVSEDKIHKLISLSIEYNFRDKLLFEPIKKCRTKHVHKSELKNSLITLPIRIAGNIYESMIYIDDENEIMSDHVTGQHLQGMLFSEASRQMFLAVTEEFYPNNKEEHISFAWKKSDVIFHNYAFPVKTKLIFEISKCSSVKKDRCDFSANISIYQNDKLVCTSIMEYETLPLKLTARREKMMASESVA